MSWTLLVLLLAILVQVEGKLCNRPGCSCKHNGILVVNKCECPSGFSGFDCGLESNNLCPPTSNPCQNEGVCYDFNKCYCHGNNYGDVCEFFKESLSCNLDSMKMSIAVPSTFRGTPDIFAVPKTDCRFERSYQHLDHTVYMLDLNLTSTRKAQCLHVIREKVVSDMSTYNVDSHFRFYQGLESAKDWTMSFECSYTSIGSATQRDVTAESSDILFAFTDVNGTLVDNIGPRQAFDIVFLLRPNSSYASLWLDRLVVYDQIRNTKLFTLIENGESVFVTRHLNLYRDSNKASKVGQKRFQFEVDYNTYVPAVKVEVAGLAEKAQIYVDYDIWVCKTEQCPMVSSPFGHDPLNRFGQFQLHGIGK